jgi:hypothetical protein
MPRFTAEEPIRIARLSNKKVDQPLARYLYVGFSGVKRHRFFNPTLAENPKGRVRWHKGTYEYGQPNLTEEGAALYEALTALPEPLAGAIWELWLPWSWRDEFGDMVRAEFDIDYTDELVAHIMRVLKDLYGDDIEIIVDLDM